MESFFVKYRCGKSIDLGSVGQEHCPPTSGSCNIAIYFLGHMDIMSQGKAEVTASGKKKEK